MRFLLLLFIAIVPTAAQTQIFGPNTTTAPTLVQSCSNPNAGASTTNVCTFGSNITAGDSLVLFFGGANSSTCATLSFSGSDTFVQDAHSPQTNSIGDKLWLYYVASSAGGYNSIT